MIRLLRFLPRRWWSPRAWRSWREYLHWRLETYGVYHPDPKRANRQALKMLLRQLPSYYRWLKQMDKEAKHVPTVRDPER